jgi:hypothetical protein
LEKQKTLITKGNKMTRYEKKIESTWLQIQRTSMNAWRINYNYWRKELGKANRRESIYQKGEIMSKMNTARHNLKATMKVVHEMLYGVAA